jgi:hypothetical protein
MLDGPSPLGIKRYTPRGTVLLTAECNFLTDITVATSYVLLAGMDCQFCSVLLYSIQ